jgi:hypothetical protein
MLIPYEIKTPVPLSMDFKMNPPESFIPKPWPVVLDVSTRKSFNSLATTANHHLDGCCQFSVILYLTFFTQLT